MVPTQRRQGISRKDAKAPRLKDLMAGSLGCRKFTKPLRKRNYFIMVFKAIDKSLWDPE